MDSLCVLQSVLVWFNLTTKVAGGHALSSQGKSPALSDNPASLTVFGLFCFCHFVIRSRAMCRPKSRCQSDLSTVSVLANRILHQDLMHSRCCGTAVPSVCLQAFSLFPLPSSPLDQRPVHRLVDSDVAERRKRLKQSDEIQANMHLDWLLFYLLATLKKYPKGPNLISYFKEIRVRFPANPTHFSWMQ